MNFSELLNVTLDYGEYEEYGYLDEDNHGSKMSIAVPVTVIYTLILIIGLLGNVLTCVVIARNSSLHTTTYYFLFNLSISHLTILIFGLPNEIYLCWQKLLWNIGLFVCRMKVLFLETGANSAILTIVAFSTERYLAICHPLHANSISGLKRASISIGAIWFISMLSAAPLVYFTTVLQIDHPWNSYICTMMETSEDFTMLQASSLVFFVIPMLVLLVLYSLVAIRMKKVARLDDKANCLQEPSIRMLVALVIASLLCCAPFHTLSLLFTYLQESASFLLHSEWIYPVANGFYYLVTVINPILYIIMSSNFRRAFRATLCPSRPSAVVAYRANQDESTILEQ